MADYVDQIMSVSRHQAMGPGREFDTIRTLLDRWGDLAVGIGDDAALLQAPQGRSVVASTDAFVEDTHFRREWITPYETGVRATAAALSDLAAMGARADALLIAFVVPERWRSKLVDVADGIASVVSSAGARIAGGNISSGGAFSITTTVIGSASRVIPRSGACVGDVLLLTGTLGGPGKALHSWDDGSEPSEWARERFARPVPRLAAGEAFAESGANAMLDISDGLAADARHMAAASRVRLRIIASAVPRGPGVTIPEALTSGEEYELLVAVAPETAPALISEIPARFGVRVTQIGEVVATDADDKLSGRSGDVDVFGLTGMSPRVELVKGHDHFSL